MTITWQDFRAQIRGTLEEPTAGIWSDASLLNWLNEGAKDIARKSRIMRDEQYTTSVVGQSSYELPAYTLEPVAVYYDDVMLTREDFADWYSLALNDEQGTPIAYAVTDDALYLRPAPDAEVTIRYFRYRAPDEITADSDEVPFLGAYNTPLAYYILAQAMAQISDWQSSGEYTNRYAESVDTMTAQEGMERQSLRSTSPREVY